MDLIMILVLGRSGSLQISKEPPQGAAAAEIGRPTRTGLECRLYLTAVISQACAITESKKVAVKGHED